MVVFSFATFCDAIPLTSENLQMLQLSIKSKIKENLNIQNKIDKTAAPAPPLLWKSQNGVEVEKLLDDESLSYRLPNETIPLRYDLWLMTDVEKANFNFSGRVKIHVKVVKTTQTITLHYREIKIDKIDLYGVDKELIQSNLSFEYDDKVEFLIISLPRVMTEDEEVVLDIEYHGELRTGSGFYRASYQRDDSESPDDTVWFATTQFEMTDARHAFPCYDEPGIRAVMNVEIQHDKSYNAISNMPIVSRDEIPTTNYVTSKFLDTPPMQTYLLAFIVSDFIFISNNDVNVEQRIYLKPQSIDRGEGDFALSVVDPILRKLEEHFAVEFPLPKMDHAGITDYIFGAMENFGLITYQEGALLYSPGKDPVYREKNMIELISHEYTHQFFGNIVNPKWWSYTWLNEAFATFFQYYIPSLIYPDEDYMERMRIYAVESAFSFDVQANDAKPLNFYVETPQAIRNKFNAISYQKGGSVLQMFQGVLTASTFAKGLNYYLNQMYFKPATPEDLHRNLQKAFDEDFPGNEVDLNEAMATWEDQAGYPVIDVQKSGDKFILTQSRFGGGEEVYAIPVTYITNNDLTLPSKIKLWMNAITAEVENGDWIVLNLGLTGYYKVSYGNSIWFAFITQLSSDHTLIPPLHRSQLFRDFRQKLLDSSIQVNQGLEMLSYLNKETESSVWNRVSSVDNVFSSHLFGTATLDNYQRFIQSLVEPHLTRLGYEKRAGESANDSDLRYLVVMMSCKTLHEDCLSYELGKLKSFLERGEGEYDLCNGLRLADENLYSSLIKMFLQEEDSDFIILKNNFILNLGCSLDKNNLQKYLNLMLDKTNNLETYERRYLLQNTVSKSVAAYETVLEFFIENYQQIIEM